MNITGNNIVEIKKNQISEYLSLCNKNNISISKIKEDLKNILEFTPAVNVTWAQNEVLNETTKLNEIVDEATKINVAFVETDINGSLVAYNVDFIL